MTHYSVLYTMSTDAKIFDQMNEIVFFVKNTQKYTL